MLYCCSVAVLAVVWSARGNPARVSRVWRGARAGGRLARAHSATQATTVIAETSSVVATAVCVVLFGVVVLFFLVRGQRLGSVSRS